MYLSSAPLVQWVWVTYESGDSQGGWMGQTLDTPSWEQGFHSVCDQEVRSDLIYGSKLQYVNDVNDLTYVT